MANKVTDCRACPLNRLRGNDVPIYEGRQRVGSARFDEVPYRGNTKGVEVVVIGGGPYPQDLYKKRIFSGETGREVENELRSNGVDPASLFFMNACRCILNKDIKTKTKELKAALDACRPAVVAALAALKPKLVVVLGAEALQQIMKQKGISTKRGKFLWSEEFRCWVFPTFHPAACFQDQSKFAIWRPDIAQIAQFIRSGYKLPEIEEQGSYRDVDSLNHILSQSDITTAFDTETQGNDWMDPNSVVISFSISDRVGQGYNVWLAHEVDSSEEADRSIVWPRKEGNKWVEKEVYVKFAPDYAQRIEQLREYCRRPDIKKMMMNGNYDLHRLRQLGIQREEVVNYVLDVQLAMHAQDPDNYKQASLEDIITALCPGKQNHKAAVKGTMNKADMLASAKEDPERHSNYACGDTDATLECGLILRNKLMQDKALAKYYVHLAHPVESIVLYEVEKNGILFDRTRVQEVKDEVAETMQRTAREVLSRVPRAVLDEHREKGLTLTRKALIKDILFSKKGFGLKPLEKSKTTGDPSVGAPVLRRMRDELPDDHPAKEVISLYLEWGPYQTLYGTFLKGFESACKPDGRLHTQISKTFTSTGRTGSRNPNLQNIPKRNKAIMRKIRSLLGCPPGKVLVPIDYSQSELRWIAEESQDSEFLRIFKNGEDAHVNTGRRIVELGGRKWDDLTEEDRKKYRQNAKPANFGLSYGQFPKGFQAFARDNYGVQFTLQECEEFRDMFLNRIYAGMPDWHERRKAEAREFGFVRSKYGFIRRLPNIHSDDFMSRSEAERLAVNTPIQSSSNDSALFAALVARRTGIVDDCRAKLVLFVHDELVYEVDEGYVDEFVPKIITCMENLPTEQYFGFKLSVPLVADASITTTNLAEVREYKP